MHTWCFVHSATFYQPSLWCTRNDIYIPQFYNNFNVMHTWWYVHSATFYQLSFWCTRNDIYIPQFYNNFPCDAHVMIYTFRNFITIFFVIHTSWYIHAATFYKLSLWCTRNNLYILLFYYNFPRDAHVMKYTFATL